MLELDRKMEQSRMDELWLCMGDNRDKGLSRAPGGLLEGLSRLVGSKPQTLGWPGGGGGEWEVETGADGGCAWG